MNQPIKPKPALVLDDSPKDVIPLARSLRLFAGVDVEYCNSIPAWERKYKIELEFPPKPDSYERHTYQVANQLKEYSTIVIDNNFEEAGDPDKQQEGLPYLYGTIGEALKRLKPEERPLVICFAPSNIEIILKNRDELWNNHGIVSFHKNYEAPYIGILTRIINDNKVSISRENLLKDIFGFDPEEIEFNTPASKFATREVAYDYLGDKDQFGNQVEGPGLPFDWPAFLQDLAQKLNIEDQELTRRIETVVAQIRMGKEGGLADQAKK